MGGMRGYGVFLEDFGYTVEGLLDCIRKAPKLWAEFQEWVENEGFDIDHLHWEDIEVVSMNWDDAECPEFFVAAAMTEVTGVKFECLKDYDGKPNLLFLFRAPWALNDREMELTKDDVKTMLTEWTRILIQKTF